MPGVRIEIHGDQAGAVVFKDLPVQGLRGAAPGEDREGTVTIRIVIEVGPSETKAIAASPDEFVGGPRAERVYAALDRPMTYVEVAERLGITAEAARKIIVRHPHLFSRVPGRGAPSHAGGRGVAARWVRSRLEG